MGFATDIMEMGRQPMLRFVLRVLLSGGFAVVYATTGTTLRGQFWKAFLPTFALQFAIMSLLGNLYPDLPQAA